MLKIIVDLKWPVQLLLGNNDISVELLETIFKIVKSEETEVHILEKGLKYLECYLNLAFACEAEADVRKIQDYLSDFKALFHCIVTVDHHLIKDAMELSLDDFDAAIELAYANRENLDAIVTLNPDNFSDKKIRIRPFDDLLSPRSIDINLEMNNSLFIVSDRSHIEKKLENILISKNNFIRQSSNDIDSKKANINEIYQLTSSLKHAFQWVNFNFKGKTSNFSEKGNKKT